MSEFITNASEIPAAPFYVTTTDRFFSGWGPATNKVNRLIFVCESLKEALIVEANALGRTDQKNVRIAARKPRLQSRGYLYQVKVKDEYSRWYQPGGFTR